MATTTKDVFPPGKKRGRRRSQENVKMDRCLNRVFSQKGLSREKRGHWRGGEDWKKGRVSHRNSLNSKKGRRGKRGALMHQDNLLSSVRGKKGQN